MGEIIKELFNTYSLLGLFVAFIGAVIYKMTPDGGKYNIFEFISIRVENWIKPKSSFSKHVFFSRMRNWIHFEIPTLPAHKNEGRDRLHKDCLIVKFKVFNRILMELAENPKIMKMDSCEFYEYTMEMTMQGMKEYEDEWEKMMKSDVHEVYTKEFMKWHEPTIKLAVDGLRDISECMVHNSKTARINATLDLFNVCFNKTIFDAVRTINKLNGSLTGKEYKGYIL